MYRESFLGMDDDGSITIVVKGDTYEVQMPARGFYRRYPIEKSGADGDARRTMLRTHIIC